MAFHLVAASVAATSMAQVAPTPATVVVSPASPLAHVRGMAVGANAAVWDGDLLDGVLPGLLSDAGVRVLRYPGGSTADVYHWQSNTNVPGQSYANPSNTFDAFMAVAGEVGAGAIVTVNYGSGTPAEAAAWVQYANRGGRRYGGPVATYAGANAKGNRYGVQYWEVGNEIYGNGTYGALWEYDLHGLGPSVYAANFLEYAAAMKAADPSIKIGAVLTAPGNWPDGQTSATSPLPWNDTVLSTACDAIDFAAVHWYPQGPTGESDPGLLAAPSSGEATSVSYTPSIPAMVAALRSQLAQYCGAHASDIEILITETNSVSYNPGKQTTGPVNALFLADSMATWLENGVTNVDWWAVHNSITCGTNDSPSLAGDYDFGDYGLFSNGGTCASSAEPAAETPFPAYDGLTLMSRFAEPRATLVSVTSSAALVSAHAAVRADGRPNVMLVNEDPAASYSVTVSVDGGPHCGSGEVWTYGLGSTAIASGVASVSRSSFALTVAPYSLTLVRLH